MDKDITDIMQKAWKSTSLSENVVINIIGKLKVTRTTLKKWLTCLKKLKEVIRMHYSLEYKTLIGKKKHALYPLWKESQERII